ncbi:hypothetical protein BCR43DRAFT_76718 [Syncephalastrum racemosum]|uniref:Uncharacterized protein n=1 Tax=Syncephalastrum racemosum TaxID=13706 RepID=A0A1X2H2E8_SYNRA|nr:hypothetical protein BCR43DRAFT_76718 [Syncephalastrum racemosum]
MDIQGILSLIKSNTAQQQEAPTDPTTISTSSATTTSATVNASASTVIAEVASTPGFDLSHIDPSVLQQVRDEYQQQQRQVIPDDLSRLLDSLAHVSTITPDVLTALSRMTQETHLLDVLNECKQQQDNKEQDFFERRKEMEKENARKRDALFAKEIMNAASKEDFEALECELAKQLDIFDRNVQRSMEREAQAQRVRLAELKVPFFKRVSNENDKRMQRKVLSILQDMMG